MTILAQRAYAITTECCTTARVLPGEALAALMVGGFHLQGGVRDAESVAQEVAGTVQDRVVVERIGRCHNLMPALGNEDDEIVVTPVQ